MSLFVGTSGWAYKEWKPDFYPQDIPGRAFLEYYGTKLSACEINATFRRMQSDETIAKWRDTVPEDFRFSTKAHRGLTYSKKLTPTEEKREFFNDFVKSMEGLDGKLGVILWQFPAYRKRDDDDLAGLLDALKGGPRFALEFRDDSWAADDVYDAVAGAGGTVCISETKGEVPAAFPPGPLAYVRMRAERYSDAARTGWHELLRATASERDVFAFTKHEGIPVQDTFGGLGLAQWLVQERG